MDNRDWKPQNNERQLANDSSATPNTSADDPDVNRLPFLNFADYIRNPPWIRQLEGVCRLLRQNDPLQINIVTPKRRQEDIDPNVYRFLGQSLIGNTYIRTLRLDDIVIDEEAAVALGEGIGQSGLVSLEISGSLLMLPEENSEQILQIFYDSIRISTTELSPSILPYLQSLKVCDFLFQGKVYCSFVSNIMAGASSLKELEILNGHLRAADVYTLTQGLRYASSLTTLILDSCNIDDEGIVLLADNLPTNSSIQHLSVPRNTFGPGGLQHLLQPLVEHHPEIRELNLMMTATIGVDGLKVLGEELMKPQSQLVQINASYCAGWTPFDTNAIRPHLPASLSAQHQEARRMAERTLLNAVQANSQIHHLDVTGMDFKLEDQISFYTQLNKAGRSLLCSSTNLEIPSALWCYILAKCQGWGKAYAESNTYYFLQQQPTLVRFATGGNSQSSSIPKPKRSSPIKSERFFVCRTLASSHETVVTILDNSPCDRWDAKSFYIRM